MSSPTPSRPTSAQPTRQQLDELEALMQRMLALPVNQLDPDLGTTIDVSAASLPLPEWNLSEEPPAAVVELPREVHNPEPSHAPQLELVAADKARPEEAKVAEKIEPRAANLIIVDRPTRRPPSRPVKRKGSPLLLRPLVWCNRAFEGSANRLGEPGRWLRGPIGRTCLGAVGILLLAAAVTWGILDWVGWNR